MHRLSEKENLTQTKLRLNQFMEKSLRPPISIEKTDQKVFASRMFKTKYALVFLALSLAAGYVPFVATKMDLSIEWIKLLQVALFCGLGMLHVKKVRQYHTSSLASQNDPLYFSGLLSFLIFIALAVLYYVLGASLILVAFGCACIFILPFIISTSWDAFNTIWQIEYGVWLKPIEDTHEKTFIYFSGIPIRVQFSVSADDRNKKIFRSLAPLTESLGDFFNHFLLIQRNNNNLDLELLDERQQPFGWKFYKVDFLGLQKEKLDPEANIKELKLKNHATIMVKRVRLEELEASGL